MAAAKKEEKKAIKTALVAGTQQTLSNLFRDFGYLWLGGRERMFANHRCLKMVK
jgi:hypothetical protein